MYTTDEAGIVAALQIHDIAPTDIKAHGPKVIFTFADSDKLRGIVDRYNQNTLMVPARLFQMIARETTRLARRIAQ